MQFELTEVICWLIVGALVGNFVGRLVTRKREGFGIWINTGIGLVGALIGGLIFKLAGINFGVEINITLRDLISGTVGALLFMLGVWVFRKFRGKRSAV